MARRSILKNEMELTLTVLKRKYPQSITVASDIATQILDSVREGKGDCPTWMDRWMNKWKNNKLH